MKNSVLIVVFIISSVYAFAQKPIDSLAIDKRVWISEHLPAAWGRLTYGSFAMEPQEFLAKLENFKRAAYDSTADEKNNIRRELKKKDIDAFARVLLSTYIMNYGIDSIKEAAFYTRLESSNEDDTLSQQDFEKLSEARYTKKLPVSVRESLDSMVLNGWEINDSALYYSSAAFRHLVELKLERMMAEQVSQPDYASAQQQVARQQLLDKQFSKGYIYDWLSYENIMEALTRDVDTATQALLYKKYSASVKNSPEKKRVDEFYKNSKTYVANTQAPDFAYRDINGKTITLKQLRGKYVYIDVWATWCGPCKAEIPHLIKLEQSLHGMKIQFVSISVDKQKDRSAWEKYVREKDLKGIQLIVNKDNDNDFIRKLNVYSIPRFILIDPDGKIVDANALRPSDKKLKEQLERLL